MSRAVRIAMQAQRAARVVSQERAAAGDREDGVSCARGLVCGALDHLTESEGHEAVLRFLELIVAERRDALSDAKRAALRAQVCRAFNLPPEWLP